MKRNKIAWIAFAFLLAFFSLGENAVAQGNSRWAHEKNRVRKQQKAYEKAQKRAAKQYYRLYRGGSYYETDQRGVDIIRAAVNRGYQQGYRAGANDRRYGRGGSWGSQPIYRSGAYGYSSYVDRSQYQYYFREGFERGYQDGYYSQSRYGYNRGGTWNIIGSILNGILNMR